MKLLLSSDLHGNHDAYRWLAVTSRESSDAVVLAGDLLGCPDGYDSLEAAQISDAEAVFALLAGCGVPVHYIGGNDDFVEIPPTLTSIQCLHGRRVEVGEWNLVGYQQSPPFVGSIHESTEEQIQADLSRLEHLLDSKTVFVTHAPAAGILDTGLLGLPVGSPSILRSVQRKRIHAHVHGHIHESFGRDGRHFNVAAAGHSQAVLLDLESLEARVLRGPRNAA